LCFFEAEELDFRSLSIDVVLRFLQSFVGLSESRIRTAVAAVKFFLKIYKRLDLVDSPLIDMFSKGAQNLAPIPQEKTTIWNPETVLSWLGTQPIPSSFLQCAREAVVLLLLATGWRVDDVWKLGLKVQFSDISATFFFAQRRKCKIKGRVTTSQGVQKFLSCERVCPVQAVQRFLEHAASIRKNHEFLFISSTGKRVSKDTLRKWIERVLFDSGILASAGSCRSASTSAACEKRRSIDDIMNSAGWSSEATFRRFYHGKVMPVGNPLNLMS
jgi:site-specific recombinase XerD